MEKTIKFNGVDYLYNTFTASEIAEYKGLRDMYYGTGGFETGTYLEQFPRESDDFFKVRKRIANYSNVFQPQMDALVDPIFSKSAIRKTENAVIDSFVKRPTTRNETISEFYRREQIEAKLYGSVFEIVDSPADTGITGQDNGRIDLMPYIYYLNPLQVDGYALDSGGALSMLVYYEDAEQMNSVYGSDVSSKTDYTYRVWLRTEESVFTFKYLNGEVISDSVYDDFTNFPVKLIETNTRHQSNKICKSLYADQFSVCKKIYNLTSWVTDSFFKNCFAFLAINGRMPETFDLGSDGVLYYEGEAVNKPEYVAPPVEHLKVMLAEVERLAIELQSNMNATLPNGVNESGEARIQKDKRRIERLKMDAQDIQDREMWLVNVALTNYILGDWEYVVTYIKDFESLTKSDELSALQTLLDTGYLKGAVRDQIIADMVRITYSNNEERAEKLATLQIESQDNNAFEV